MCPYLLNAGYEIMQYSICNGWINNLYDGNDNPYVFSTLEEAIADLQEEFDNWKAEIETETRGEDEGYDIGNFKIAYKTTEEIYELDLIDGRVIVSCG